MVSARKAVLVTLTVFSAAVVMVPEGMAARKTLNVWHALSGGDMAGQLQVIAKQYERTHPGIAVRIIAADINGEKFLTSMAAGSPPDVIFPDGGQVVQWAFKDLLQPLDTYIKGSKVDTNRFFPASFKPCTYKGKPYALPWLADANFSLVYYKPTFNEVGLAGAPQTWEEQEIAIRKLYKQDSSGQIQRMGLKAWDVYGPFNTLFTLGSAFGGDLYDEVKDRITFNDPRIIKCFDWIVDQARRNDWTQVSRWQDKYASWGKPNPLVNGRLGMTYSHSQMIKEIALAKKDYDDFGFGYVLGPEGGRGKTAWIGGWTSAIPRNSKNRKEAWDFIKWLCYDNEGNVQTYKQMGFLPTNRTTDVFTSADPKLKPWINVLNIANVARPITPAMPIMSAEMDRIFPLALSGKKEPRMLLDTATVNAQKELDRIMKRKH